jgi:hypothetical protein
MAANDLLYRRGTQIVLGTGTVGVDVSGYFNFYSSSGHAIQSLSGINFGNPHADEYEMFTEITTVGAPTDGTTYDFYMASSLDNVNFAGKANTNGNDYMTPATFQSFARQLEWLGSMSVYASGNETQRESFVIRPITQYGRIIMYNGTNSTTDSSGSYIILTPLIPQIQTS